jgi:demethylmenaquinone methyltransferase/2-methoxy-6-polyprenyl-1,4-benzoquinol methylase
VFHVKHHEPSRPGSQAGPSQGAPETHFGFETIPAADKAGRVRGVFESVASRYDLMNDLMSGGLHRLWKDALVDWLAPRPGMRVLDVAGGTGDVAFRILQRQPTARVAVLDLTEPMLVEGRRRALGRPWAPRLDWVAGDAMALPFPDASFDAWTVSFGIRNVTDPAQALREAFRVLRRGGRLVVLEFSRVAPALLERAYDAYSFNVIPRLGEAVTGDRASYQYLVESIRRFPDQEAFLGMVREAGFERASFRNLSLGVACLHSAWKA